MSPPSLQNPFQLLLNIKSLWSLLKRAVDIFPKLPILWKNRTTNQLFYSFDNLYTEDDLLFFLHLYPQRNKTKPLRWRAVLEDGLVENNTILLLGLADNISMPIELVGVQNYHSLLRKIAVDSMATLLSIYFEEYFYICLRAYCCLT